MTLSFKGKASEGGDDVSSSELLSIITQVAKITAETMWETIIKLGDKSSHFNKLSDSSKCLVTDLAVKFVAGTIGHLENEIHKKSDEIKKNGGFKILHNEVNGINNLIIQMIDLLDGDLAVSTDICVDTNSKEFEEAIIELFGKSIKDGGKIIIIEDNGETLEVRIPQVEEQKETPTKHYKGRGGIDPTIFNN